MGANVQQHWLRQQQQREQQRWLEHSARVAEVDLTLARQRLGGPMRVAEVVAKKVEQPTDVAQGRA